MTGMKQTGPRRLNSFLFRLAVAAAVPGLLAPIPGAKAERDCFCLEQAAQTRFVHACTRIDKLKNWPLPKAICASPITGENAEIPLDEGWWMVPNGCGDCEPCVPKEIADLPIFRGPGQRVAKLSEENAALEELSADTEKRETVTIPIADYCKRPDQRQDDPR